MNRIYVLPLIISLALFAVGCNSKEEAKTVLNESLMVESADSIADAADNESMVVCHDTVINGFLYRSYFVEAEANDCSRSIYYILPVPNQNKILDAIVCNLTGTKSADDVKAHLENSIADFLSVNPDDEDFMKFSTYVNLMPVSVLDNYVSFINEIGYMDETMAHYEPEGGVYTYDLATGERILQDEIFVDSHEDRLALAKKLRSQADEDLGEFDASAFDDPDAFLIDEMLNNHFYFTADSLVYYYLAYEMNFAAGFDIECAVSKDWVKPYLKKDGPLYRYWFEN